MRPVKENLGTIPCPLCGDPAHVRQAASRKKTPDGQPAPSQGRFANSLYIFCEGPNGETRCGVVQSTGPAAQERIRAKTHWFDGKAPPLPEMASPNAPGATIATPPATPASPKKPAASPAAPAAPDAKRRDLWDM